MLKQMIVHYFLSILRHRQKRDVGANFRLHQPRGGKLFIDTFYGLEVGNDKMRLVMIVDDFFSMKDRRRVILLSM